MRYMSSVVGLASLCMALNVYAGAEGHGKEVHWGYEGEHGPAHWAEMKAEFKQCDAGLEQSPVDLGDATKGDLAKIEFSYQPSAVKVLNNGHTVQVNYSGDSSIKIGAQVYKLVQFHFHSPSENTVKKKPFDMELHLVHKNDKGELAVVGVFMQGGTANQTLEPVWANIPKEINKEATLTAQINVAELLPAKRSFYHFKGSLTTPPCSEGVQWFVMKEPTTVSAEQVKSFVAAVGNNARPVQALNQRSVVASE
ncbi:MAG: carbonic anhydrase [Gammaproteobacteria bacterium]|nr:carbonic anhydrase [Gammaproteobacteria bacterium]